jgi:hypothetical protein
LIFMLAPLLLTAALSAGPIHVTACYTEPVRHARSETYYDSNDQRRTRTVWTTTGQRAVLSFVNTAQVAATQISFQLSSADNSKVLQRFTDRGTFAPNVSIKQHKFDTSLLSDPVDHPVCTVLGVKFADGSSWLPSPQP